MADTNELLADLRARAADFLSPRLDDIETADMAIELIGVAETIQALDKELTGNLSIGHLPEDWRPQSDG